MSLRRRRYTFRGTIQGVGFRPTVYRCARSLRLYGFVQNRRSEVVVEVEGPEDRVEGFADRLRAALPPAASIESMSREEREPNGDSTFRIAPSEDSRFSFPPIPPDLAMCDDCRRELLDPKDRRFLYPFITCTQCGPRYSIVVDTPFDRENTSMAAFAQCAGCLEEYGDPGDRRFHSQTNSCSACGPRLVLWDPDGAVLAGDPVRRSIRALGKGKIVAVMGLGGFHLAADPRFTESVRRLRSDKERERKPFALMVRDLEEAETLCVLDPAAKEMLRSSSSPICILPSRIGDRLRSVSDTETLGIMLPYTPLHTLLFYHPQEDIPYRHLIMTSGNRRDEPVITDPREALEGLTGVADLLLVNDRRIVFRTDDSIVRFDGGGEAFQLRRSRGFVPAMVRLHRPLERPALAVGGDLKNAPALGLGADVYLAPYIGDLANPAAERDFEDQIEAILGLYGLEPEAVVCDLHPEYHSTRYAESRWAGKLRHVQHHHAHLLSVMAEHGLEEAVGLSFDGTGYGADGAVWGGEFLWACRSGYRRLGSFADFLLPGGEAAIRHPIRIAYSILSGAAGPEKDAGAPDRLLSDFLDPGRRRLLADMIEARWNCPVTSSAGRLFDAAAALLRLVDAVGYEGEGPIRLEGRAQKAASGEATPTERLEELVPMVEGPDRFLLDAGPLIGALAGFDGENRREPDPDGSRAFLFHEAVARAGFRGAERLRAITGSRDLCLSGGVFQNRLLRRLLVPPLCEAGFRVYLNRAVPPGDGGLSVGQLYFEQR